MITSWQVFSVAVVTALATGVGVLPLIFIKRTDDCWRGIAAATASGMMLSASVFALADKALRRGDALDVIAGIARRRRLFRVDGKASRKGRP